MRGSGVQVFFNLTLACLPPEDLDVWLRGVTIQIPVL